MLSNIKVETPYSHNKGKIEVNFARSKYRLKIWAYLGKWIICLQDYPAEGVPMSKRPHKQNGTSRPGITMTACPQHLAALTGPPRRPVFVHWTALFRLHRVLLNTNIHVIIIYLLLLLLAMMSRNLKSKEIHAAHVFPDFTRFIAHLLI